MNSEWELEVAELVTSDFRQLVLKGQGWVSSVFCLLQTEVIVSCSAAQCSCVELLSCLVAILWPLVSAGVVMIRGARKAEPDYLGC